MNTPLYKALIEYSNSKLPFHMPGHKFGSLEELKQLDLWALDNTEALGMDNLYEAEGIIKEAMELMAEAYGAMQTIFLTNGSTVGILASILAVCKPGDQLIVARNTHHSVWSGLILAGVSPIYITPNYIEGNIFGEITSELVEEALMKYPKAKAALIVSPTYEGITSDIEHISKVLHKYDKLLIVDEAHGAHFILGDEFSLSSIKLGADLVINSMHKTLPTLTQSALLHICSHRVKYEKLIEVLRMVQTSSPSYLMMGIMDYVREYIERESKTIYFSYTQPLISFRDRLKKHLKVLKLLEIDKKFYDISKVIIFTTQSSINGYELADRLSREYSIVVEAALNTHIILMTTLVDNKQTLARLEEALTQIDEDLEQSSNDEATALYVGNRISRGEDPRAIYYGDNTWQPIEMCKNKKVAKNVMLYPPGIPIVALGEVVQQEHIEFMIKNGEKLQGVKKEGSKMYLYVTEE